MNILEVTPFLTPARGGLVTSTALQARQMVRRGHGITILTTDYEFDNWYSKSLERDKITVVKLRAVPDPSLFLLTPSVGRWLSRRIKDYDVIHMHGYRSHQNVAVHNSARKHRIPYVLQAHGSVLPSYRLQKFKKLYDFVWGGRLLREACKLIASTDAERDQYLQMGAIASQTVVLPNWIGIEEYNDLPKRGRFRRRYGIDNGTRVVLYLGRIHSIKGLDLLVEAFSGIIDEEPNSVLVIAGPDDGFKSTLRRQIEELKIADRVLFTGPLYEEAKVRAYVDSDVYVLPSVYESFGSTVLEAGACGVPVVVTDRCGCAAIASKIGLVTQYDSTALRESILRVLADNELKDRVRSEGANIVKGYSDPCKRATELEAILEDCVNTSRGSCILQED